MNLHVHVAGTSDVGLRSNNEDNFAYDVRNGIFIVCDGMGGLEAGEVASKVAVDCMLEFFRNPHTYMPSHSARLGGISAHANRLADAIQLCNEQVHEAASHLGTVGRTGATIVSVFFQGDRFCVGHVGDSRVYLVREGDIEQLTEDHSLVVEQVRRGILTEEEASRSPQQNVITRALGPQETVEPDLAEYQALPGDLLLLCTDGLSTFVPPQQILTIAAADSNLSLKCEQLVHAAKQNGSDDNITCLLLEFSKTAWYSKLLGR